MATEGLFWDQRESPTVAELSSWLDAHDGRARVRLVTVEETGWPGLVIEPARPAAEDAPP